LLSTAVADSAEQAATGLVDSAVLLRTTHSYAGYLHLKLPPGVSHALIEAAARVSDRLSLNIEVPSAAHQAAIDPSRDWHRDVIARLAWMRDFQQAGFLKAGIATQFVVGAAGEDDKALLDATAWLHRELAVRRVYYAPFQPIAGTPMAEQRATPAVRGLRLTQADWLLRHYGFASDEIVGADQPLLSLSNDPKLDWALRHPEYFPIEINTAAPEQLLRIPGVGPLGVKRLMRMRTLGRLREPAHIAILGAASRRVVDFVLFDGVFFGTGHTMRQARIASLRPVADQLRLW
jgi:predicted DNA-binding helix-hairpin-helix protein